MQKDDRVAGASYALYRVPALVNMILLVQHIVEMSAHSTRRGVSWLINGILNKMSDKRCTFVMLLTKHC